MKYIISWLIGVIVGCVLAGLGLLGLSKQESAVEWYAEMREAARERIV